MSEPLNSDAISTNLALAKQAALNGSEDDAVEYVARHIEALNGRDRMAGDGRDAECAVEILRAAPDVVKVLSETNPMLGRAIVAVDKRFDGEVPEELRIVVKPLVAPPSASSTAPTSPLVDLRYTASPPAVGECQVVRDGARWVLRPHAPHVEGQCSCCAEITLVVDVDVALSAAGTGRWLVTRNDGADLGHLTDVPEPAPWLPVAVSQPAQPQGLPTLDEVIAVLVSVAGSPARDLRTRAFDPWQWVVWNHNGWQLDAEGRAPSPVQVCFDATDETLPVTHDRQWLVSRDGLSIDGDNTVTLDALPGLVREAIERLAP